MILLPLFVFTGQFYGKPFLDPYSFVSGGLYNSSNVELTNGNERGVATLRDGESHVGFRDLDFGDYGSDEITLPLFPLGKEPFTFEVWEGMPLSGGEKICDLSYDLGSVWNTYQEAVYKLPRRLKGVTTLCLVFHQKVHIKGFRFTKYQKAFQRLLANESNTVYGDSYKVTDDGIEGIGNNVTLVFERMDFGMAGASRVSLCWRSICDKNAIQFVFQNESGEKRAMVDVGQAKSYTSCEFPLPKTVTGQYTVSLVFLPGCNLDLRWIQFMP